MARYTVAGVRLLEGRSPGDARIREIVDQLTEQSPDFVEMWARHEARSRRLTSKRFHHPEVGDLTLAIQAFDVRSSPGQELVVYRAEPGTSDAEALALLGVLAAGGSHPGGSAAS